MFNSLRYLDTERLPVSITETTTWTLKNIPVIGGFLGIITLGMPIGWNNSEIKLKAKKINGLIPSVLYDFATATDNVLKINGAIPMDIFRSDTADTVGALVGSNMITSVIRFKLTDKIRQDGIVRNTLDLGQEGANGYKLKNTATLENPLLNQFEGFAIDLINIKFLGKCDYTVTAFSKGAKTYEAKFQSKSKFSDSAREWSNTIKLSNWENINDEVIDYPEAITPPKPIGLVITDEVDINNKFGVSVNRFNFKTPTDNTHESDQTQSFNFAETFGGTLSQLIALGYKTLTINYDLDIKINNDYTIFKKDYTGNTLTLDLNTLNDSINRNILNYLVKHATWTYDTGNVGGADKIWGDLKLESALAFSINGENIILDYHNAIKLLRYKWSAVVTGDYQYFELNGDWPINWYLNIKPKIFKLSK